MKDKDILDITKLEMQFDFSSHTTVSDIYFIYTISPSIEY